MIEIVNDVYVSAEKFSMLRVNHSHANFFHQKHLQRRGDILPYDNHRWKSHDDVIKWKHFPRYWPFVRGVPGEFPAQRPVTRSFDVFFDLR